MKALEVTKSEKARLWVARIFGIILSASLAAFLVLFYLKLIDGNMFGLAALGLSSLILVCAGEFMTVKSVSLWVYFCFIMSLLFAIGFIAFLMYLIMSGTVSV